MNAEHTEIDYFSFPGYSIYAVIDLPKGKIEKEGGDRMNRHINYRAVQQFFLFHGDHTNLIAIIYLRSPSAFVIMI